jgi:hypothetical protein
MYTSLICERHIWEKTVNNTGRVLRFLRLWTRRQLSCTVYCFVVWYVCLDVSEEPRCLRPHWKQQVPLKCRYISILSFWLVQHSSAGWRNRSKLLPQCCHSYLEYDELWYYTFLSTVEIRARNDKFGGCGVPISKLECNLVLFLYNWRGLSGKYPAILNISRTGCMVLI